MKRYLLGICMFALIGTAVVLSAGGCSDGAPTAAPPITGKIPDWKTMTKEEKIALIKKQAMPEDARQNEIKKIEAGLD